jgi:hypothetical protein
MECKLYSVVQLCPITFSQPERQKIQHLNALLIALCRKMQWGISTDARLGPEFEQDTPEAEVQKVLEPGNQVPRKQIVPQKVCG